MRGTWKRFKGHFGKALVIGAALLIAAVAADPAQATPLTTPVNKYPDITVSFIQTNYNFMYQWFNANGYASTYATSTQSIDLSDYFFNIGANIDRQGAPVSGWLNISSSSDQLLTGNLVSIGYASDDPTMQFLFDVTGGSAASDFGQEAFVTLSFSGFDSLNSFTNDWGNFGDGMANVQAPAVPEPGTVTLFLVGAGGLILYRRRKASSNG